jgi:PadR family transcriptional regulator PadR
MFVQCIYIYRMPNILYYHMRRFVGGDAYCCDMRGMLGFLILFLLSKRSMHGQELADEIAKRKGEKPSPGTIYPALKSLRELGFIRSEEKEGKTIVYTLTECTKNFYTTIYTNFSWGFPLKSVVKPQNTSLHFPDCALQILRQLSPCFSAMLGLLLYQNSPGPQKEP